MKQNFLLTSVILLASVCFSMAQTATVISIQANVREFPSNTSKVIFKVNKGAKLKVTSIEHTNGWYLISKGKLKGWIYGNSIEFVQAKPTKTKDFKNIFEDEWIIYGSSASEFHYYNPSKMTRAGQTITVWTQARSKSTYELLSTILYQIDCAGQKIRSNAGVTYYESGAVKSSWDKSNDRFTIIIPDTIAESLSDAVCKYVK